jgi:diketogulonate reductase-like aldo/keto reductase
MNSQVVRFVSSFLALMGEWKSGALHEDVEKGLDKTLEDLGVEYLDLFLMHLPV